MTVLGSSLDIVRLTATLARATVRIDRSEPVFEGHFPGCALLPGVCVLESARLLARAAHSPARPFAAEEIESVRFVGPVFPGDVLTIDLSCDDTAGLIRCRAVVTTTRGVAARIRLCCRVSGGGPDEMS